ncbi:unnamed protein product [Dicrocoelium dendriticum]|nr:unnamed protein product [Dicrocoelium dendriticum]
MALVNYESSGGESTDSEPELRSTNTVSDSRFVSTATDKVEPEYKMRMPMSAKQPSLLPSFTSLKLKTGKVLVSVPVLEGLDSSSSESDADSSKASGPTRTQRPKKGSNHPSVQQGGGLLTILPPVRSATIRDGVKPSLMVPHQLASNVNADEDWDLVHTNNDNDTDSEDGAEASTFFSFDQPPQEDPQAVAGVRAAAATRVLRSLVPSPPLSEVPSEPTLTDTAVDGFQRSVPPRVEAPLCTIDPKVLSMIDVPQKASVMAGDDSDDVPVEPQYWTEDTFVPGPERKRARLNLPGTRALPVADLLSTSNQVIREVKQADLTAGADVALIKSVTSDESQYVSRSSTDDPGKLAHRKHQITWLAHQAQEKEMELEKRWSEARHNKASNRAKYGF